MATRDLGVEILAGIEEIQGVIRQKTAFDYRFITAFLTRYHSGETQYVASSLCCHDGSQQMNSARLGAGTSQAKWPATALLRIAEQHPEVFINLQ